MVAEGGAFNDGGSVRRQRRWGLWIGDDKEMMEIDISGGNGGRQHLTAAMDKGGCWHLTVVMDGVWCTPGWLTLSHP